MDGMYTFVHRIIFHGDKDTGKGLTAGALVVERRVVGHFVLPQT